MLQPIVHYSLHFLFPALLAFLFFRDQWKKAYLILLLTMAVDLDHLVATPVFAPGRCSIGFHPLHTWPAMLFYIVLLIYPNRYTRIIGLGLLFHMLTDFIDCLWMFSKCPDCCLGSQINWICNWWLGL